MSMPVTPSARAAAAPGLERRYRALLERLRAAERRCGRAPGAVTLLAVSKTWPATVLAEAAALGLRRFGENYLQEALQKQTELAALRPDVVPEWHFIGPLQSNKTRAAAAHFAWVHSVDRIKIAERLSAQRPSQLPALNVLLQVNVDDEASKSGLRLDQLPAAIDAVAALPRLRLRGLMAIPAEREDFDAQREPFARLRIARDALAATRPQLDLATLSMGMSGDLEAAVAEGATLVRIGSALFGPRRARS